MQLRPKSGVARVNYKTKNNTNCNTQHAPRLEVTRKGSSKQRQFYEINLNITVYIEFIKLSHSTAHKVTRQWGVDRF